MIYPAARLVTIACVLMLLNACGGGGGASSALPSGQSSGAGQSTAPPQDTQPPVITLVGEATLVLEQGTTFVDPGATASDAVDGAVTVSVTGSVGDAPGSYTLTYSATDRAGNQASITRTVVVQAMTTEPTARDLVVFNDGLVGPSWDEGINAFDEAIGFSECNRDGGAGCPSIAWRVTDDEERGPVLEIEHAPSGRFAGVFLSTSGIIDLSDFSAGSLVFDVRIMSGDSAITMKLDCNFPCTSGDRALGSRGASGWERVEVPLTSLVAGGLNLRRVNTGIVIWATETTSTRFRIDNVHFAGLAPGASLPTATLADDPAVDFTLLPFGAGTVADKPNPASRRCVFDFGNFIFNAGVVRPEIGGCDVATSTPFGEPTPRAPQLTGPAAAQPTMTHRWWGSLSFLGEMQVGAPSDAAFITPDPINARITERGVRLGSIPAGLKVNGDGFLYPIPDPFAEVFDGIAIANSDFDNLEARLKDFSEGSVTVEWQSGTTSVMTATFVHGSPYVFFDVHAGDLLVRTLRADGGEKGTFYRQGNSLGVTTNVAGQRNNFLLTGEGATSFEAITSDEITVKNARGAVTVTYLPEHNAVASEALARFFETRARNVIASVSIDYALDPLTQAVTVTHRYLDSAGALVNTLAGLQPLHWKHSALPLTNFSVRSARGVTRFAETASFSYTLPWVGVLPSLPPLEAALDPELFASLLRAFIDQGPSAWNTARDTYFTGKNYGKVAELIALAHNARLEEEATILRDWLKAELEDWFTASTNDVFDEQKYFAFDSQWNTLLGFDEAFASHQQLNDHHFHYGYFVRAAAEICRVDADWCGADQWGPMVELLIRDYAGGREDPLFPYLRHFDPANGFSWASGQVNFVRGNNNESTSEAANAYGAMVLYGLATGNSDLTERGIYLHASQTAAAREYWTNIDGHEAPGTDRDNFPPGYGPLMTSIVWGDGGAFATFFSGARAHILGIQTLPINGLMLHLGVDPDYLRDYVALGLSESTNGLPSGLVNDQWPDIWWNVLALTDPDRALADYETLPNYLPEGGETKAHTYHWLKTLAALGHIQTGTGALTVDYPTAVAFERSGVTTYVAYNFDDQDRTVRFSDGQTIIAAPGRFTIVTD